MILMSFFQRHVQPELSEFRCVAASQTHLPKVERLEDYVKSLVRCLPYSYVCPIWRRGFFGEHDA
jgi:hypothetical protein